MSFAQNIKHWRQHRGYTQEQLAEKLDLSRQAIAKWETGQSAPDIEKLVLLSMVLDVSADRLLKEVNECENQRTDAQASNLDELSAFLVCASARTYAGYGAELASPSRMDSHEFRYEQGCYIYLDSYVGGEIFAGSETVYHDQKAIWAMNYNGRTLSPAFSGDFLKEALQSRPMDKPFRGPACYRRNEFSYYNRIEGELDWFSGTEEIYYEDICVYQCRYHGGLLKS